MLFSGSRNGGIDPPEVRGERQRERESERERERERERVIPSVGSSIDSEIKTTRWVKDGCKTKKNVNLKSGWARHGHDTARRRRHIKSSAL